MKNLSISIKKLLNKYKEMPLQVKASLWFLICAFLQKGISFITTPIFTRILTTEEYGQYNVFNSWLGIITVIVTLNLSSGVYVQGLVKFEDRKNKFTSALQGLTMTLLFVWLIIYLIFHDFWNNLFSLSTAQILLMFVIIWTTAVVSFWSAEQRVEFKYRKLVVITVAVSILRPALSILLIQISDDKVTARIVGMAVINVVAYTGLFVDQMRRGKKFFSADTWKYVLAYNIPLIPHYLSNTVLNSSDRIMISRMVGTSEAGIYSLAYSVSMIMSMFNQALTQTIEPWLYKKMKEKQIQDIPSVAYPSFILIAIVNLLLIAFAPEIVAIFAPPAYYDAIYIIPPVAMSVYFIFIYYFFVTFEFYYEKTRYITLATLASATSNILLNFVFIKMFGYYAAGYTTLICFMLYAGFHYIMMNRIVKQEIGSDIQVYNLKYILIITIAFMGIGFLMLFTYQYPIMRYSILTAMLIVMIIKKDFFIHTIKSLISMKQKKME
mgnify:CR=1 FL=1